MSISRTLTGAANIAAMFVAMPVMAPTPTGPTVIYVDDDAPPGGDGLTWETAYRFLQDAIAASGFTSPVIRVAQGLQKPDRDEANPNGTGDREAAFELPVFGVTLLGGYAGLGSPDPDDRDPALYESILSGDLAGDDEPGFVNNDENSVHVVDGGTLHSVIDGLTITGGNATGFFGGGIHNIGGNLTVANCRIVGNFAGSQGGGMSISFEGNPTLIMNCVFENNGASSGGGGMYIQSGSSPTLVNCTFRGNTVLGSGDAMRNALNSDPVLINCAFIDNTTMSVGGAVANGDGCSPMFTNCLFVGNSAASGGGAIESSGVSFPNVVNSIVYYNDWPQIVDDSGAVTTITYSDEQYGWPGTGNIDADPLFVDPENGDFRLLPGSPCIDAADNTAIPLRSPDLDGNPRLVDDPATRDTGFPIGWPGPIVDMGAYEYQ
ncbi:MAG: choice-of-anchor Q domain-containing protein, partial [Planctomycetota bacterium]